MSRSRGVLFLGIFLCSLAAHGNLSEGSWTFHTQQGDYVFPRAGSVRGTPYVCLPEIISRFQLKMVYDPEHFKVLIVHPKRANYASFFTHSTQVELIFAHGAPEPFEKARRGLKIPSHLPKSQIPIELSRRPEFVNAELCVPIEFGDRVLRPLLSGKSPRTPVYLKDSKKLDSIKVVLDPGHGGNDYGAVSNDHREKDLVLQAALSLREELQKLGITTLLTRDNDTFVTLSERARMANQSSASLFLSLHMNAHATETKLKGFEIYLLSLTQNDDSGRAAVAREQQMIPDDLPEGLERAAADLRASANFEKSLSWSDPIRNSLSRHFAPSSSRNIRMGPFYVLYAAQMPALLLELGYISHEEDRQKILDADTLQKLSRDLAKSIAQRLGSSHDKPKQIRKP